jgi:hypothetical protein
MTRDGHAGSVGDIGLLARWGVLVVALVIGGLFISSRAGDDYTSVFGFLLTGFGAVLGLRLLARITP